MRKKQIIALVAITLMVFNMILYALKIWSDVTAVFLNWAIYFVSHILEDFLNGY